MATSRTGSPLSTFTTTPEGMERAEAYREAQENLRRALDQRENRLFDPQLLALSQAFLTPTKTGSFGEVIGNVAGSLKTSQQEEQNEAREIAGMRLELAKQGLQSYQTTAADRDYRNLTRGMTGQPPIGGAASAGAPSGAPTGAPVAQAAPQASGRISATPAQVLQLSDPRFGGRGEGVVKALNYQRDQIVATPQGLFDKDKGQYIDTPLPNETQSDVRTPYGTFELFPFQVRAFLKAEEEGRGREYLQSILNPRSPVDGKPAPSDSLPPSVTERNIKKKIDEERAIGLAKTDIARTEDFIAKGVSAKTRLPTLASLNQFVSQPDAAKLLGVFEGSKLGDALAKMVEPNIQQIRNAFIDYGLPKNVKADQAFALQQIALINLEMRKINRAPGEGAQSDMENRMALAAGLDEKATPQGMKKKIGFLTAQAEFQRDVMIEMNKSEMTAKDFITSDKYDGLLQNYEKKLMQVLNLRADQVPARGRPAANRQPTGNSSKADELLRKALGD